MFDIQAVDLMIHINEMKQRAKVIEEEARESLAVAKAIRAEAFTLENAFSDSLKKNNKEN